jgi:hypothetical protein
MLCYLPISSKLELKNANFENIFRNKDSHQLKLTFFSYLNSTAATIPNDKDLPSSTALVTLYARRTVSLLKQKPNKESKFNDFSFQSTHRISRNIGN